MAIEPYASHTQIDRVLNDEDGVYAQQVQCEKNPECSLEDHMLMSPIAGAMNVVDAEPLDGVDFKNGVLAYVTLVCCIAFMISIQHIDRESRPSTQPPSKTALLSPEVSFSQAFHQTFEMR